MGLGTAGTVLAGSWATVTLALWLMEGDPIGGEVRWRREERVQWS